MKTFIAGAIVGAGICFAVIRVVDSEPARIQTSDVAVFEPKSSALQSSLLASCSSDAPSVTTARQVIAPSPVETFGNEKNSPTSASSHKEIGAGPPIASSRISIDDLSEKEAFAICSRASELHDKREREKKNSEPKDPSWAYSMESLIRQHIESQIPAEQYTKLQIQCRTTFCELQMEGPHNDARTSVDKVIRDIEFEPWSGEVVSWGSGGGFDGRQWNVHHNWYRPREEPERQFLLKQREQRRSQRQL